MPAVDNLQLLITLSGNAVSAVAMLVSGLYVLSRNSRRPLNLLFFLLTASTAIFAIDFVIASLIHDPQKAYAVWMFNVLDVFITTSVVHFLFETIGERTRYAWYITLTYVLGFSIVGAAFALPHAFLPYVAPRLYFPTYLVGGPLYAVMLVYFLGMPLFPFMRLVNTFLHAKDLERRRYEYFIYMMLIGYGLGCFDFPLVFGIPINPVFGMLFGLYLVPIAYGIISDQLFDIRVFLERTVLYVAGIASLAGALIAFVFLDNWFLQAVPEMQAWTVPVFAALIVVLAAQWIWRKLREIDNLKYQFVTIAAHKLHTPLAHIRWQSAALMEHMNEPAVREQIGQIYTSATDLLRLTDMLLMTIEKREETLALERVDLEALAEHALARSKNAAEEKKLQMKLSFSPENRFVIGNAQRLELVIDVLIDNAIRYTPPGGQVELSEQRRGRHIVVSIRDSGMGIAPDERKHLFTRFFRSAGAKLMHTEGVGLGLWAAKNIITAEHGSMGAFSDGAGKGSTFWFSLPPHVEHNSPLAQEKTATERG